MAEELNASVGQSGEEADQEIVTLGEILQSEQQMMDDANAVLGALDDKKCTYSEGYMKRQALYSCLTCIPEAKLDPSKAGGVCLACCYCCHEGHELVELYTKRNFRCDCGNGKFPNRPCSLDNSKDDSNEFNQYNQNFTGLYCTCKRPYPDAEDPVSDEMIQCIICEDWYHSRHLGVEIPALHSYSEMSCEACIKKHPFLLHYDGLCVNKVVPSEQNVDVEMTEATSANASANADEITADVDEAPASTDEVPTHDVEPASVDKEPASVDKEPTGVDEVPANNADTPANVEEENTPMEDQTPTSTETEASVSMVLEQDATSETPVVNSLSPKPDTSNNSCKKPKTKSDLITSKFWADVEWRKQLCNCPDCFRMYEEEKVMFLIDPLDTVQVYEEKGKVKAQEFAAKQHEDDMKFLNSLDRVPLMEAIAGFNDLKTNLMEYLKKFAENKKIVREEDIREFFSNFDSKKKQKCEIPHYCR